jgi:bifunctional DNA-binding transcriptional regulator/antitoxin component of YhaV-PrlF toxin-antitoxin module
MVKHKRLTSKSGITIPKDMRAEAGFFPSMSVDMTSTPDGIVIKPHVPVCRFCGSVDIIVTEKKIPVCRSCAEDIQREVTKRAAD